MLRNLRHACGKMIAVQAMADDPEVWSALSDPDRSAIERDAKSLRFHLERMQRILEEYGPRPANAYERMVTSGGDPGCQSCARLEVAAGVHRWEPVDQGVKVDGEVVKVCRWCRRWVSKHGALPDRKVLEAHHRGERIRQHA